MFFTFSQPQHVLNLFLLFWRFSASCSYKKGSYKKKRVYITTREVLSLRKNSLNTVYEGRQEHRLFLKWSILYVIYQTQETVFHHISKD